MAQRKERMDGFAALAVTWREPAIRAEHPSASN
jgi:hypothetical protein